MKFTQETARKFLDLACVFYTSPEEVESIRNDPSSDREDIRDAVWGLNRINLNDTLSWGFADCVEVENEELPELAELYWKYGYCGMLYWSFKKLGVLKSEFKDINRFIEFVKFEENIIEKEPSSSKRAYQEIEYTISGKKGLNN